MAPGLSPANAGPGRPKGLRHMSTRTPDTRGDHGRRLPVSRSGRRERFGLNTEQRRNGDEQKKSLFLFLFVLISLCIEFGILISPFASVSSFLRVKTVPSVPSVPSIRVGTHGRTCVRPHADRVVPSLPAGRVCVYLLFHLPGGCLTLGVPVLAECPSVRELNTPDPPCKTCLALIPQRLSWHVVAPC